MFDYKLKPKELKILERNRPKGCATPKLCVPLAINIGGNGAGSCVGLIIKKADLDCIKHCHFIYTGEKGYVDRQQFCCTPLEAIYLAQGLIEAICGLFYYSDKYWDEHKKLTKLRKSGKFNRFLVGG